MRKVIASIAVGIALLAAVAVAQVTLPYVTSIGATDAIQVVKSGQPTAQSTFASALQLQAYLFSGNSQRTGATAPALTSCGTSPTISGNDFSGTVTMGTGTPTGCIITFNTAYAAAPHCVVTSETAYGTTALAYSVTTTAITTVQSATSSNKVDYVCITNAS